MRILKRRKLQILSVRGGGMREDERSADVAEKVRVLGEVWVPEKVT
jgi:hypothetical protein